MKAFWAARHGEESLHPALVQEKLVNFFAGRGVGVKEISKLTWPGDGASHMALGVFASHWEAIADDAGISGASDRLSVQHWLRARSTPPDSDGTGGRGTAPLNPADKAAAALRSAGVTLDAEQLAALQGAMHIDNLGDEKAQCAHPDVVAILMLGRAWDATERAVFAARRAAAGGHMGRVDVRTLPFYPALLKNNTHRVFERVVRNVKMFEDWVASTSDAFHEASLPRAAARFTRVIARGREMAGGDAIGLLNYMRGYILLDFAGRGLPEDHSSGSAHFALTRSKISFDPTITSAYDLALAEADPHASPSAILRAAGLGGSLFQTMPATLGEGSVRGLGSDAGSSDLGSSASHSSSAATELASVRAAEAELRRRLAEAEADRAAAKAKLAEAVCNACNGDFCGRAGCDGTCKARRKGVDFARNEQARLKKADVDKRVEEEVRKRLGAPE